MPKKTSPLGAVPAATLHAAADAGFPLAGASAADDFNRVRMGQLDLRYTLAVLLIAIGIFVPQMGNYGMYDPWETHYAEVARQMTKRGDYISLWWPCSPRDQEVFWSKPVLTYWLMSIGMNILRIGLPGGDAGEMALGTRAEWAVRTPEWAPLLPTAVHPDDGPRPAMLFEKPDDRWEANDLRQRHLELAEQLEATLRQVAR